MTRARPPQPDRFVDVIAPASPFDVAAFQAGLSFLESRGLRTRSRPDVTDRDRFLAGSDQRRVAEIENALEAPDSDVLWCVRGGYGASRLLPSLSLGRIGRAQKLLIGFSDITVLHARWLAAGVPSLHGSMVARLPKEPSDVVERLFTLLRPGEVAAPLTGQPLVGGRAEGVVAGGNLALLAALCGTPYQPDLTGALVVIEDVSEKSYRLDRMFVQCEQAGLFRGIAGLAFGEFFECGEDGDGHHDANVSVLTVLTEHARRIGVPAIMNLPFGHGAINMALPFGVGGRIDADAGRLEFLEPLA
jgi:muramoyltetrapeptide carboxypeptidase